MEPYADACCILKVNVNCEACKMKVVEVLSSVIGVYSVDLDAQEGLAKVYGEVDPNMLLKALARTGKHAELAWVKLKHPVMNPRGDDYHNYSNYGYRNYDEPHSYSRYRSPGWQQQFYPPRRSTMADHQNPYNYYNHYHQGYGSSYRPHTYPYDDYTANNCTIM
ncbi:uncharacterized protein [Coffea arabica]|uniref:HMA domain-containing protein n=1 Tax=Coffea arabica TaxID=13443 RepID=A0A6P6VZ75_COFAR|nr:uncharacterized protein LOC113728123 [Coffea arabica]XP_027115294.1 uncharacterized protein LOC113733236 [Coffea arabica]